MPMVQNMPKFQRRRRRRMAGELLLVSILHESAGELTGYGGYGRLPSHLEEFQNKSLGVLN